MIERISSFSMLRHDRHRGINAMRNRLTMLLTLLAVAGTASLVTACNTTAGAGKDISAAGTAIENSAEKNKGY
jgi:predicted small secreted protein